MKQAASLLIALAIFVLFFLFIWFCEQYSELARDIGLVIFAICVVVVVLVAFFMIARAIYEDFFC